MRPHLLILFCVLTIASGAIAQTKTSGTLDCGKPAQSFTVQDPGEKDFSYIIGYSKCTWTKSYTVAGLQSTINIGVGFDEQMGTSGKTTNAGYTQYQNGDKAYWRYDATFDTKALTSSGTWTYTRGTGKLFGIKGSGTCTCKLKPAGAGSTCEIKGDYTLLK